MKTIKKYFTDGGTANNGDFGNQKSVICVTDEKGTVLVWKEVGDKTNNEAELLAILACLRLNNSPKLITSDSQLAINLCQKKWKTKIDRLNNILKEIWLEPCFADFVWETRDFNRAGWKIQEKLGL